MGSQKLIRDLHAEGLQAEENSAGEVAVATKNGAYLGAFAPDTPVKTVIVALTAYARGLQEGARAKARKSRARS